jgi:hypothetical protein
LTGPAGLESALSSRIAEDSSLARKPLPCSGVLTWRQGFLRRSPMPGGVPCQGRDLAGASEAGRPTGRMPERNGGDSGREAFGGTGCRAVHGCLRERLGAPPARPLSPSRPALPGLSSLSGWLPGAGRV